MSLHLLIPPLDGASRLPWFPMHHVVNNSTNKVSLKQNIVDDLAQSPTSMSTLEVLKNFPSQHKELLFMLGVIDLYDSMLITFDLDQGEPKMPSSVSL